MVMEAVKYFTNIGLKPVLWYWRSYDGLEVDLILRTNATFVPIEIKLTASPASWCAGYRIGNRCHMASPLFHGIIFRGGSPSEWAPPTTEVGPESHYCSWSF